MNLYVKISIVACFYFVAVLVSLEREVILAISPPDTYPLVMFWQLLWPVGLVAFGLLLSPALRWSFLGIAGCLSVILLAVDVTYFEFFDTVTSLYMAASIDQLMDVGDSVVSLFSIQSVLPILLFLPFFGLAIWSARRNTSNVNVESWGKNPKFWSFLLILLNFVMAYFAWNIRIYEDTHHLGRDKWVLPSEHWNSVYSRSSYASTFGIFNYHIIDFIDVSKYYMGTETLTDERRVEIQQLLAHKKQLNDQSSPLYGIGRGRDNIVLQLESLQHFLLDLEVRGHEVMPVLNRLKKTALSWDSIFDVTHIGRTSDAEFATMTGLLPDVRKPAVDGVLSESLIALPKELKKYGYSTASIHGYKASFWNRSFAHPLYGIEEMHFEDRLKGMEKIGLGPSDQEVFGYAADLLEKNREQLQFIYLISLTSHHPYVYAPEKYITPYAHLQQRDYGLLPYYLASASYTDEAVGLFLEKLAAHSLLEKSIIVIFGDHDRGGLAAKLPIPEVGLRMNSPVEDRIPMLILVPGQEKIIAEHREKFRMATGGLHDIAPTLLHLLGEDIPFGMLGSHLFIQNPQRDVVPLPVPAGNFAYRGHLLSTAGQTYKLDDTVPSLDSIPTPAEAYADQLAVQDLLDHYDEIMSPE